LRQAAAGTPDAAREEPKGRKAKKAAKAAANPDKKSPKKKIIMIAVVVLLVAFEGKGKLMKPHYGPGHPPAAGVVYALGASTITTNLSDGHLAQVGISLQLTKAANSKMIGNDVPELTSSTIQILSGETYDQLLGSTGRTMLRQALLSAYDRDLGESEGGQQVSGVYFTAFVLQ
jgi:flagellar basal body-associated protein FliL